MLLLSCTTTSKNVVIRAKKVVPTDGNETDLHNMEKKLLVKKVKLLGTAFPSAKYF